jgi:DNA-binding MarR family transcriptional regulator
MTDTEREDLGAMFARITRRLIAAEQPLLDRHGLSMWAYIALSQVVRAPAATQLELSKAIRYDKTRLIALLDDLERDGLLTRRPDPADRRARIVEITPEGRRRHAAVRAAIRAMEEEEVLAGLDADRRSALLDALAALDRR